ncbi:P1 family peptidase [Aliiroseovarius sp. PTFE2010]|uniref:P1 family peptidase n=1 Tax=Aliiroseovarius sp. PTFE2010 TaxID=3417190 RepID=UPI003CEEBE33
MAPGPRNLITDVTGVVVGNAQDDKIKSGVTVLMADAPFTAGVHVMGGAPGTRETDLLAPDKTVQKVDALVLSGGSALGLSAASGVTDALRAQGRGFDVGGQNVPIVPAAILFDLINGGNKDWAENPYPTLGASALAAAGPEFSLGSVGAGTGATTATLKGGLGSASIRLPSGHMVGALVAANPIGSVIVGDGPNFHAGNCEFGDEFGGLGQKPHDPQTLPVTKLSAARAATTIAVIATDAALTQAEATRMAIAAHDGMARAIWPAHTPHDGDLVFAAATGRTPAPPDALLLGHTASLCLARAIARAIFLASPAPGDVLPTWSERFAD